MDEEFDPGNNTTVTLMTPQASTSARIASHEDAIDQSLTILPPSLSARALPTKDTAEISLDLVPIFEPHSSDRPQSPATVPEPPPPQDSPAPPGEKRCKIKINSEVEKIVVKIWNAAGDIIMPGHSFDGTAGRKPPRAKETIAHLQTISQALPSPDSPSASSVSSAVATGSTQPSSQQILTAHLLVSLLSSPPQFSLPLSKVKELLAEKAGLGPTSAGQSSTRVLYGCVAKRLIRIERGGGEQVVKFDI
ncbi:hypothetical protein BD779DRAFT_139438 [Infundibulicybe gibba]|nr:hypothetical protein BD779DRAFT_139438 [Infundibulicybe gibba]